MKFFIDSHGVTLQAPEHVDLADFPTLTMEDKVDWSYYLEQVVKNSARLVRTQEPNVQLFWHAKYYGLDWFKKDRVTPSNRKNKGFGPVDSGLVV